MNINSDLVRNLRAEKRWSQEQLGDACGLNLRTIQRLENTGKASLDSIEALASVFEVDVKELELSIENNHITPIEAVKVCFAKYANFSGTAPRSEYWWFFLFLLVITAVATIVNATAFQIVAVIAMVPFISAGTRRLNDTGQSGWWQLLLLVPFGQVVVFYLLAQEGQRSTD